eukprot:GHVT01100731.1.p2 GENE.GHVT01100731.1~~GHVT01100731.1.p2  ORF type:complete len:183 (+),score=8.45 GHVT01100731.1:1547-2095(+)
MVDRDHVEDRRNAVRAIAERQNLLISTDEEAISPLVIFPEGTTTNGQQILPFKLGAFKNLTPVTPVLLVYKFKTFSPACEILPPWCWLLLILSSASPISMDAFYLSEVAPPKESDMPPSSTRDERVQRFAEIVRHKMMDALYCVRPRPLRLQEYPAEWIGGLQTKRALSSCLFDPESTSNPT